ncbi:MAG TPA: DUF1326 domain-containing protein [Tepidisphaeraceae bacterium]|jgi:hypothetical protein|nr:DUF1326 domain-containing protein [Tepidisphaeraceae bacterium]
MRFSRMATGIVAFAALVAGGCGNQAGTAPSAMNSSDTNKMAWAVTLDNIEACSCPTFCQCYFTGQPALHEANASTPAHAMRFCRFNNAFRVADGHYGDTNLTGLKFWMAGDLGGDFSKGQMDWAVVRFEPSATPQQREAAVAIVKQIFPVTWNSFTTGQDAKIDWSITDDSALARLNDGKSAEVVLKQNRDASGKAVVIQNVQFWAAPSNTGFRVMKNEVEAYRDGDKPFEFKQTNGFFTTIRMNSADAKGAQAAASSHVQLLKVGSAACDGSCCEK